MAFIKKLMIPGSIVAAAMLGAVASSGLGLLQASAATNTAATTTSTTTATADTTNTPHDESKGGHVGANGTTETLLTGDTAEKVKAAALAANPGSTILRVENDAEGATYEAHITKSDNTQATVKLDGSFKVTATEAGGPGGHGGR